jgi:flagellar FliJ protein
VKRFHFKLEKLLEVREFYERKAELVLAEKAGICVALDGELKANASSRHAAKAGMFGSGKGIEDYRAAELYVVRLDRERERVMEELARAEAEREKARLEYVARHTQREAIDKLKERRQAEYYRLAEREETKQLDDIARRPVALLEG